MRVFHDDSAGEEPNSERMNTWLLMGPFNRSEWP